MRVRKHASHRAPLEETVGCLSEGRRGFEESEHARGDWRLPKWDSASETLQKVTERP